MTRSFSPWILQSNPRSQRLLTIKGVCACHLRMADVARKVRSRLRGAGKAALDSACQENGVTVK